MYLPHFRRVIDEGVASVMTAYNSVNGQWCGQSPALLEDVLRGEWGFGGFVISDWLFGLRDAIESVRAGLDIEMPYRMVRMQHLEPALASGELGWDVVDRRVEAIVATLLRFDAVLSAPAPDPSTIGSDDHRSLAHEAASRSVVLLANEPVDTALVLPIPAAATVAVIGPLAERINLGDGGSSDVWDLECTSVLDGIAAVRDVVATEVSRDLDAVAAAAASADVAIVVVGYTYEHEGEFIGATDPSLPAMFPAEDEPEVAEAFAEYTVTVAPGNKPGHLAERAQGFSVGGDRGSLRLLPEDVASIRAAVAANPRTVVVVQAGSAVVVDEWLDEVPALVQAWYGGWAAGPALAEVLTGTTEPSGRLPFSVPRHEDDLPHFDRDATTFTYDRWHGWWHLQRTGRAPRFPFGFGLSYTTCSLTGADATVDRSGPGAPTIRVEATVDNVGARPGSEVVQVYADDGTADRPDRLIGFARVEIAAGDTATVIVDCPVDRLARRVEGERTWRPASGSVTLTVGLHAGDERGSRIVVDLDPAIAGG